MSHRVDDSFPCVLACGSDFDFPLEARTTRAPLTIELLREIAFNKSSRLVISTVNAWREGMSKPIAIPLSAAIAMMNPVEANPSHTPAASENAQIICAACVITRMDLFG